MRTSASQGKCKKTNLVIGAFVFRTVRKVKNANPVISTGVDFEMIHFKQPREIKAKESAALTKSCEKLHKCIYTILEMTDTKFIVQHTHF